MPQLDLLEAIKALLNAILSALGLGLPLPVSQAAQAVLDEIGPIPAQLQVLPEQILDSVR